MPCSNIGGEGVAPAPRIVFVPSRFFKGGGVFLQKIKNSSLASAVRIRMLVFILNDRR